MTLQDLDSPDPTEWIDPAELRAYKGEDDSPQVQILQQAMVACQNGSTRDSVAMMECGPSYTSIEP
jgi:hypothetical protein